FFSSRRRHTRSKRDWSSDVCSSDLCGCRQLAGNVFDYAELTRRRSFRQAAETSRLAACATRKNPHASARFVARATKQNAGRQREIGRASCRERVKNTEDGSARKKNG